MRNPMHTTLHAAALPGTLEHWAAAQPDAVALVDGDRQLRWAEWNTQADRLAAALHARGLGPGDIVVLRTQTRLEWPVVASALAKLGCWLLGLNWRLTNAEIRHVLNNSRANAIVCDDADPGALLPAFEGHTLKLAVSLDAPAPGFVTLAELMASAPTAPPLFSTGDPPLIIYTSGTTGLPKGVVLDRKPSADDPVTTEYLLDVRSRRQTAGRAAYLLSMPMHHGSGPGQLWSAQRAGALTVLQRRFDAEEALALIARHRLTHWTGVPTMYKRIAALPPEAIARHDLGSIEQLTVGAAPVSADLKRWIIAHLGDCLHEGYGSTETGMVTHMPPAMQQAKPGSSGLPYRHVRLEIRGPGGEVLPTGETGEIWAWTPANIRNYLNAPPLDTETLDARGYFRTGDMGHLDADGYLWISDRAKDMVISGGVNIYPAEVEAALLTHPALSDAAVIGIPDEEMGERVMAFCEPKPGHPVTEDELLAHCVDRLASYKRPRAIRIVGELPRNTVGKLLKRELRAPFWQHTDRKV
ncbi:long-chain fatty acid--CoA ligase [Pseudorhodoferax sp. Leaf274]|nr:long-chain fatty acid--CoA ligase [Pseudorhodoferax sp. Leaf274]